MQHSVEQELGDADAALLVVDGQQGVGPGDRFIAKALLAAGDDTHVVCAVNKCDRLGPGEITEALAAAAELECVDDVFPVSARTGAGLGALIDHLASLLPEGPLLYPPEEHSDLPSEVHVAELIREQVLRRTRDEVPHAVEVVVDEIEPRADGLVAVRGQVWVETESQKGILVGKGGRMIREVGTAARKELERDLGSRVFLDLQVKVRRRWRRDESLLDRIGIE
jgi:GTP-binding protein Era